MSFITKKHIVIFFVVLLNLIVIQSIVLPYRGAFIIYIVAAFVAWRIEKYLINDCLVRELYNLKMYFSVVSIALILFGIYLDLKAYVQNDTEEIFPYIVISYFSLFSAIVGLVTALWYLFKIIYNKYFIIKNYQTLLKDLDNL